MPREDCCPDHAHGGGRDHDDDDACDHGDGAHDHDGGGDGRHAGATVGLFSSLTDERRLQIPRDCA